MSMLSENDIALAGEYVLGLLDAAEHATANARIATDAAFVAEVDAWRDRLASMAGGADVAAPDNIWANIDAALPLANGQDVGRGNLRLWQGLTAASLAVAAYLGFLVANPPVVPTVETPAPLVAALGSENGKAAITARYDVQSGELLLTPVSLDTGKLYPELWIIPADGTPHSLGMMAAGKSTLVAITPEMQKFMAAGGTLAITSEPEQGGPGGKPSGPIVASGKITVL
jgi:anti-sigma-K factor RskA